MKNLVGWALRRGGHKKRLINGVPQIDRTLYVASQKRDRDGLEHEHQGSRCGLQMLGGTQCSVNDAIVKSVGSGAVEERYRSAVAVRKVGEQRWRKRFPDFSVISIPLRWGIEAPFAKSLGGLALPVAA